MVPAFYFAAYEWLERDDIFHYRPETQMHHIIIINIITSAQHRQGEDQTCAPKPFLEDVSDLHFLNVFFFSL